MAATLPLPAIDEKLIYYFRSPPGDCQGLSALDSSSTGWQGDHCNLKTLPRFDIEAQGGAVLAFEKFEPCIAVRAPWPVSRCTWEVSSIVGNDDADAQAPAAVEFFVSGGMGCIQDPWTRILLFTPQSHKGQFLVHVEARLANQFEIRARVVSGDGRKTTWRTRVMLDRLATTNGLVIPVVQLGGNVV